MRSTYRLGIDLFLPNFNGISSSTAGFRAIFFKPPTSSWRFLLQVPLGTEDQFLEQYLNPSKREDFIEHKLPWLPETDRFDTASFREGEDCVQFAMKLGALKKNIFLLTLKKHVHDTIMILMTDIPYLYTVHLQNRLLQNSPVVGFFRMQLCALRDDWGHNWPTSILTFTKSGKISTATQHWLDFVSMDSELIALKLWREMAGRCLLWGQSDLLRTYGAKTCENDITWCQMW